MLYIQLQEMRPNSLPKDLHSLCFFFFFLHVSYSGVCILLFSVRFFVCFLFVIKTIVSESRSVVSDSVTPWTVACQAPLSMEFSRQEYCHALLQEIFPTQGLNPGLPHCRQILYHLSHQGMLQKHILSPGAGTKNQTLILEICLIRVTKKTTLRIHKCETFNKGQMQ